MTTLEDVEFIRAKVAYLEDAFESKADHKVMVKKLTAIKAQCDKGLQFRIIVGRTRVYPRILDILSTYHDQRDVCKMCFKTLIALMRRQPDLLDDKGLAVIVSHFPKGTDPDLKKLALKWAKECCIMHEKNRQTIFNTNVVAHLKQLIPEDTEEVVKEGLALCRALVLDDDIRVEYGKAHEHARIIANETLCSLIALLQKFQRDAYMAPDVIMTITSLLVREEFCLKVESAGVLDLIKSIMLAFDSNEKILKQCFRLLKAVSGNDYCKTCIVEKNFAPVFLFTLTANKTSVMVAVPGLQCVAAISLRCPQNSKALIDVGMAKAIVSIMKEHPEEESVQKAASWAIRNMVSRNKTHGKVFIQLGVEELLQEDLRKFEDIEYDVKAALRDLNCNVNLKEEWTGKGGALTTGFTFSNIEWS